MREQLFYLWGNYEILKFLKGDTWIQNREREICECLTDRQSKLFIELQRFDWILDHYVV
jgi:hypothetical protein